MTALTKRGVKLAALQRGGARGILDVLVCIVLVGAFWLVPDGVSILVIWTCLSIVYVGAVPLLHRPVTVVSGVPTYATIEVLFFLFYYMIYFWPYQQYAIFGGTSLGRSTFITGNTFVDQSNHAIIIATLGLVAFHAGFGTVRVACEVAVDRDSSDGPLERQLVMLAILGQIVTIVIYLLFGLRAAGEGRYTETTSGGVLADGVSLLILMFCMVVITLAVSRKYRGDRLGLILTMGCLIAFVWAIRLLLLGDRNSFLLLAIVALGGIFTCLVSVGRIVMAILASAAMILYNAVELSRSTGPSVGALFDALLGLQREHRAGLDSSSFDITTIGFRATLAAVPSTYDYGYGWFKLIGFGGIIPFVRGGFTVGLYRPNDIGRYCDRGDGWPRLQFQLGCRLEHYLGYLCGFWRIRRPDSPVHRRRLLPKDATATIHVPVFTS